MTRPFVSIIIPCRNESTSIRACLDSVLSSTYPANRMEVLIADGISTDGTQAILAELADRDRRVRIIDNPDRITPSGLNRAIAASSGNYILRIDAHSVIERHYVAALVRYLERHPEAWGAGGRMETKAEKNGPFARAITTVLSHRFGVGNSRFRTDVECREPTPVDTIFNCCWRRTVFSRVGMFHEHLVRSQDIEMSSRIARAGGTLWLVPEARTTYFARVNFWSYLRHNWSNGVWSLVPAIYLGSLPVGWRHLMPLAFVASLLGAAAIALAESRLWWLVFVPAGPYAFVNLAVSLAAAWRARDPKLALLLPISFAGLHLAYGAGSLWGALRVAAHALRPTHSRTTAPMLTSESGSRL